MRPTVSRVLAIAFFLGLLAAPASGADAPALVSSVPEDGATDVALDVGAVRLVFDRPMKQNSHTLWGSDRGALPPLAGEKPVVWKDEKTCEIRLGPLEADTQYALQLNSKQKQGFRSAEDNEPLPVTVISFHTAAAPGPAPEPPAPRVVPVAPAPPVPQPQPPEEKPEGDLRLPDLMDMGTGDVVGHWVLRDEGSSVVTHIVVEDKGWARKWARIGEAVMEMWDGVAGYRDGHLYVWDNSFTPPLVKVACRRDGDRLLVTDGDKTLAFQREGEQGEPEGEPLVPEERPDPKEVLPGEWWYEDDDLRWTFGFDAEGNFSSRRILKAKDETSEAEGTWSLQGESLVLRYRTGQTLKQGLVVADPDTIEIKDSKGVVLRLYRDDADTSPGGPEDLPGVWETKQEGKTVRLTLWRDGRMTHEQVGDEVRRAGRYKVAGGAFKMRLNGREEMRFPFRWIDREHWSTPADDGAMDWRRVGEAPDAGEQPERPERPEEPPGPEGDGPRLEQLVGSWEGREGGAQLLLTFASDETFTLDVTQEEETETMRGTFTLEGRTLTIVPEGDEATELTVRRLDEKTLVLVDDEGDETTFTAKARAPKGRGLFGGGKKEEPKPPAPKVAGEWLVRTAEMEISLSLKADGTFREVVRTMQGTQVTEGRYEVQGNTFIAHPEGKETRRFNLRFVDADTLEITDDAGNGVQMKRM